MLDIIKQRTAKHDLLLLSSHGVTCCLPYHSHHSQHAALCRPDVCDVCRLKQQTVLLHAASAGAQRAMDSPSRW